MVRVRGYDIPVKVNSSSARKAQQFANNIAKTLARVGVIDDDIEVPFEQFVIKQAPASVTWWQDGNNLHFKYEGLKFIENLFVVWKVVEKEVDALLNNEKTPEEFYAAFTEDEDVDKQRKEARKLLGVPEDTLDMAEINAAYKKLAKQHHPDAGGDIEEFKAINRAHKVLKRELE